MFRRWDRSTQCFVGRRNLNILRRIGRLSLTYANMSRTQASEGLGFLAPLRCWARLGYSGVDYGCRRYLHPRRAGSRSGKGVCLQGRAQRNDLMRIDVGIQFSLEELLNPLTYTGNPSSA